MYSSIDMELSNVKYTYHILYGMMVMWWQPPSTCNEFFKGEFY